MHHARNRVREITDRSRLLVPVNEVVHDLNRFLRGWSGYVRYGSSARQFDKIDHYALDRLARFVAKRHKRDRGHGLKVVGSNPATAAFGIEHSGRTVVTGVLPLDPAQPAAQGAREAAPRPLHANRHDPPRPRDRRPAATRVQRTVTIE